MQIAGCCHAIRQLFQWTVPELEDAICSLHSHCDLWDCGFKHTVWSSQYFSVNTKLKHTMLIMLALDCWQPSWKGALCWLVQENGVSRTWIPFLDFFKINLPLSVHTNFILGQKCIMIILLCNIVP